MAALGRVMLLAAVVAAHVWASPFAKVEESFNLQATHDILFHGADLAKYDHLEFPGVVPRTFLGAIVVAAIASPASLVLRLLGASRFSHQILVRLVLGTISAAALEFFCTAAARVFGHRAGFWLRCVVMTQFHFLFYASRTLPNTFAVVLVALALAFWLRREMRTVIALLAFAAVVFRAEVAVLAAPLLLEALLLRRIGLVAGVAAGVVASLVSLVLTVAVDSVFWQRWLWPEGEVFYFNTVLNRSAEWGTEPFWWYFDNALPRALLAALPLAVAGVALERRLVEFLTPCVSFVLLYSLLPHKELRFIMYVVPLFNLAAAVCLAQCEVRAERRRRWATALRLGVLLLAASLCATGLFAYTAAHNYPGGYALRTMHEREDRRADVHVHIDAPAAMTGASRFGELRRPEWRYSKDEGLTRPEEFAHFTHLITSTPDLHSLRFESFDYVTGLDRVVWGPMGSRWLLLRVESALGTQLWPPVLRRLLSMLSIEVRVTPKLFLMRRRDLGSGGEAV